MKTGSGSGSIQKHRIRPDPDPKPCSGYLPIKLLLFRKREKAMQNNSDRSYANGNNANTPAASYTTINYNNTPSKVNSSCFTTINYNNIHTHTHTQHHHQAN